MTSETGLYMQISLLYGSPKKGGFIAASMGPRLTTGIDETCSMSAEDFLDCMKKAIEEGFHKEDYPDIKHALYDAATLYHKKETENDK